MTVNRSPVSQPVIVSAVSVAHHALSLLCVGLYIQRTKKKAAVGYEDGSMLLYKEVPVADFVMSEECLSVLASASRLMFDKQSGVFLRHPLTSEEVRSCCEDIRVLGQRELKTLLAWRRKMRVFLKEVGQGSEGEGKGEGEGGSDGGSDRQEAGDVMEGVDEAIKSLRDEELADAKR